MKKREKLGPYITWENMTERTPLTEAAPNMLKTLRQLDAWFASGVRLKDDEGTSIVRGWIRSAIARAEGRDE